MPDDGSERREEEGDDADHRHHDGGIVGVFAHDHDADEGGNDDGICRIDENAADLVHEDRPDVPGNFAPRRPVRLLFVFEDRGIFPARHDLRHQPLKERGNDGAGKEDLERAEGKKDGDLEPLLEQHPDGSDGRRHIIVLVSVDERALGAERIRNEDGGEHQGEGEIQVGICLRIPLGKVGQKRHKDAAAHQNDAADDKVQP